VSAAFSNPAGRLSNPTGCLYQQIQLPSPPPPGPCDGGERDLMVGKPGSGLEIPSDTGDGWAQGSEIHVKSILAP
jgi:hypothetical protein